MTDLKALDEGSGLLQITFSCGGIAQRQRYLDDSDETECLLSDSPLNRLRFTRLVAIARLGIAPQALQGTGTIAEKIVGGRAAGSF